MISQYQVPVLLAHKLPEIKSELQQVSPNGNIFKSIEVMADYTRRMAMERHFDKAEKCMKLADKMYAKGDARVKTAVENVFVYSFSTMMACCNIVEWRMLQSFMPVGLYTLYMKQVLKS